jgi:hypothetical protein
MAPAFPLVWINRGQTFEFWLLLVLSTTLRKDFGVKLVDVAGSLLRAPWKHKAPGLSAKGSGSRGRGECHGAGSVQAWGGKKKARRARPRLPIELTTSKTGAANRIMVIGTFNKNLMSEFAKISAVLAVTRTQGRSLAPPVHNAVLVPNLPKGF